VLATKPPSSSSAKNQQATPIFNTKQDNLQILTSTLSSDDADKKISDTYTNTNSYWKVQHSQAIRVNVGVPTTRDLLKQQIRWKKCFIRSPFSTGGMYWKRPFWVAVLHYIQTVMKFVRPYVLFRAVFMLPLVGDAASTGLWFLGVMFTGMIYTVDFRLRNPGDSLWLYRPIFTLLTAFVYTWLLPYAAETIKNKAWR
jgi:hyaluronan synthase